MEDEPAPLLVTPPDPPEVEEGSPDVELVRARPDEDGGPAELLAVTEDEEDGGPEDDEESGPDDGGGVDVAGPLVELPGSEVEAPPDDEWPDTPLDVVTTADEEGPASPELDDEPPGSKGTHPSPAAPIVTATRNPHATPRRQPLPFIPMNHLRLATTSPTHPRPPSGFSPGTGSATGTAP